MFNKGLFEELDELITILNNNFKENFYLEIQRHGDKNEKEFEIFNLKVSKKYQIPIIATNEVYYLDKHIYLPEHVLFYFLNLSKSAKRVGIL